MTVNSEQELKALPVRVVLWLGRSVYIVVLPGVDMYHHYIHINVYCAIEIEAIESLGVQIRLGWR